MRSAFGIAIFMSLVNTDTLKGMMKKPIEMRSCTGRNKLVEEGAKRARMQVPTRE